MSASNTEALAQALVKQTEKLVHKNILEFAFRAILAIGMSAADLGELTKDVLHKVKTDSEPKDKVDAAATLLENEHAYRTGAGTKWMTPPATWIKLPNMNNVGNAQDGKNKDNLQDNTMPGDWDTPCPREKPRTGGHQVRWAGASSKNLKHNAGGDKASAWDAPDTYSDSELESEDAGKNDNVAWGPDHGRRATYTHGWGDNVNVNSGW